MLVSSCHVMRVVKRPEKWLGRCFDSLRQVSVGFDRFFKVSVQIYRRYRRRGQGENNPTVFFFVATEKSTTKFRFRSGKTKTDRKKRLAVFGSQPSLWALLLHCCTRRSPQVPRCICTQTAINSNRDKLEPWLSMLVDCSARRTGQHYAA